MNTYEEVCACCTDWQKTLDRVTWTKLMQILKVTFINWRERKLTCKLYIDQRFRLKLEEGRTLEEKSDRDVVCHRLYSNLYKWREFPLASCLARKKKNN